MVARIRLGFSLARAAGMAGLREMEDGIEKQDEQARKHLQGIPLEAQMARRYQIGIQIHGPVYGLNNDWTTDRLKPAPEQRIMAAEIRKNMRERMREASRGLGNLSPEEQRAKIEEFGRKSLEIREAANKEAGGL